MTVLVCVYKNCHMHYSSLSGQKAWKKDMPNLFTIALYISWPVQRYFAPYYDSTPTNFIYTLFEKKIQRQKMLNISETKYRNHGKLELFYVHKIPDSSNCPPLRWLQRLQIVFSISLRSHDSSPEATHRHRMTRTKLRNIVTTLF